MRHSIKRISKSALSVILALMMVVSTMAVGIVTANAASISYWSLCYSGNSWANDDNTYKTDSDNGTITYDTNSSSGVGGSFYFRLVAHMSDNTSVHNNLDANNTKIIDAGVKTQLVWKCDTAKSIEFKSTKRYMFIKVESDGTNNYVTVTESDTNSGGGGGETTTNLATSTNTLFVAYDKRTSNAWNRCHFWNSDGDIHKDQPLTDTSVTGLKFYDIKGTSDEELAADKQINFIAHYNDWQSKYQVTNATNFKKGVQWYAYNDGKNSSNAQYTPLAIKSLSTKEVTSGQDNTITFTPAGGVPYFLSDKGTSANYTLNVYKGSGTSGTQIVNNASIANAGTYAVTWNPSSTSDNQLTFVLSDGIDSVSYPADFTVKTPVTSYTVTYGVKDGNGNLEATANGSAIGSSVTAGTSVTFTATPNDGYEVEGWYSNEGCTTQIENTGRTYSTQVNSDTTVYVKFKEKTVTTGDWYISGWIDKDKVDKPADKYKFTGTTTSGVYSLAYTFSNDQSGYQYITINDGTNVYHPSKNNSVSGEAADGNKTNKDFNSDPKWMVKAAKDQSVEFTWNANTKTLSWKEATSKPVLDIPSLTFSANEIPEASGSSVTLTVDNHSTIVGKASDVTYHLYKDGNLYKTFTTATYEITEAGSYKVKAVPGTTSSNTYNESAFSNEQTITKAGNLAYKYYLIGDNGKVSYEMTPSESNPKILYSSISFNSKYWFKIKRVNLTNSSDVTYSVPSNSGQFTLTPTDDDTISAWNSNNKTDSQNYKFEQSNVYYIKLDFTSSDTKPVISLSQTTDGKKSINVYTKDGTTVEGGTSPLGDTVLKANSSGDLNLLTTNDKYNVYTAKAGDYLTIQTTMTATAAANGYYVYAFCVNGISYPASAKANNVYETTYKVLGDEKNNLVEITPLYFNKNTEKNNDYITVYVDASELGDHWGNTISCYSYYYTGGSNKEAYSTTGYPGQPMILSSNGLYYTRVPKYAYSDGQRRTKSDGKSHYTISGITLNSFIEKELHGTLYPEIGTNYQTYDYDDFKYIADLDYDTVKFEIKYRTKTSNQSTLLNNAHNHPTVSGKIDKTTYAYNNGWDNLLNFDGEHVDILGNKISNYVPDGSHLYVVSTGNQDVADKGQWSTVWYVYDNGGNYVTQGVPSDFIARPKGQEQTKAYKAIEEKNLTNVPVKITYESEMDATNSSAGKNGNTGVRIDGRWLYTKSTDQNVPVTVKVQYRDSDTADWKLDANETAGTIKIDDVTSVKGVATKTFTERNVNAAINATSKSGYVFVEWGTVNEDGNNYTKLPVNSSSMDFLVDKSYTIVARFAKIQEGILSISHEKYTGDGALGGGGYYLVSAVIKDSNDNEIQSFPETEEAINIALTKEMLNGKYTIDITLKTIMKGENTFVDYFRYGADGYEIITADESYIGKSGTVTQQMTVSVEDLYYGGDLQVSSLQYYSDIAPVTKDAILYYKYYNRFGEERTYTKVVPLSDEYIEANKKNNLDMYFITNDLIYENAPAVEDLHKKCTWTITDKKVTRQGTTATLWGTHTNLMHTVFYSISEKGAFTPKEVKDNDYLLDGSDEFFVANPKSADGNTNFAYWIVYDLNEHDKGINKEIAKCYSTKFNLRILGDYYIYPVYGVKSQSLSISDPTFTREQYTDSTGEVKSDYLYADFIVAYMSSKGILLNGELAKNKYKYHTGLIVEFSNSHKIENPDAVDAKLTDAEFSALKAAYTAEDSFTKSEIESFATSGSKSGSVKTDESRSKAMYKFDIKNEDYNNKNRLDYYVKFPNTPYYRHYVYKAYYYVYYTNDEDKVVYDMTQPVYFTLFDIGNSSAVTTKKTTE